MSEPHRSSDGTRATAASPHGGLRAGNAQDALSILQTMATPDNRSSTARRIPADQVIGVRMKDVFDLAKASSEMDLDEVQALLRSPWYEGRLTAVSILDFRARRRGRDEPDRAAIYAMYLDEHAHIDSWCLVDRAAPRVVGDYLLTRPRDPLLDLARSARPMERRTAITAAFWLIRARDLEDPFLLVDMLLDDHEHFVQTSVGIALRELGKIDAPRTARYVEENRARLSPATRRLARVSPKRTPEPKKIEPHSL
ncbi:DNA alkylation repair protein [Sanguibacter sp. 25GB23B1]|uniref:DNA alkylation repair protein n=1 Tax=unclassified Sanguibacter TaxID=2645534 RepID=UPI0032AEF0AB